MPERIECDCAHQHMRAAHASHFTRTMYNTKCYYYSSVMRCARVCECVCVTVYEHGVCFSTISPASTACMRVCVCVSECVRRIKCSERAGNSAVWYLCASRVWMLNVKLVSYHRIRFESVIRCASVYVCVFIVHDYMNTRSLHATMVCTETISWWVCQLKCMPLDTEIHEHKQL